LQKTGQNLVVLDVCVGLMLMIEKPTMIDDSNGKGGGDDSGGNGDHVIESAGARHRTSE